MVRRYVLSKRERRKVIEELRNTYTGLEVGKNVVIEIYEDKELGRILIFDDIPAFFEYKGKWIPHLKFLLKNMIPGLPIVVVDMGAVKPLLRGADLMAPGIRMVKGEFKEGDVVVVVDEKYNKPFVVGIALVKSKGIVDGSIKKGRVVENIHRVGDKLWKITL